MNNKKLSNPKTEVPSGLEMNDKDYLDAVLEGEKNLSVDMCYALNEASNEQLYSDIFPMFKQIKDCQRNLFELAFKKGWYELEEADPTKISEAYEKNLPCYNELNCQ